MIHDITVKFTDSNNLPTVSPVFDMRKVDLPQRSALNPSEVSLQLATFFLVWNLSAKKFQWIRMEDCDIVKIVGPDLCTLILNKE
jgi:hypothetical protein